MLTRQRSHSYSPHARTYRDCTARYRLPPEKQRASFNQKPSDHRFPSFFPPLASFSRTPSAHCSTTAVAASQLDQKLGTPLVPTHEQAKALAAWHTPRAHCHTGQRYSRRVFALEQQMGVLSTDQIPSRVYGALSAEKGRPAASARLRKAKERTKQGTLAHQERAQGRGDSTAASA
ncbi:hypothetical protein M427DRAFT_68059 [Gonapodya prolifera JEL478]|uniref:Uncharacterized protein n=1 Tax=Gonapodya prolifera (strain JEL478) TaxID=1344416 RepID=A0A139AM62_GONPJ|nr:hypothetical protein M427DRAFT_68059 [Gonapodya prolifera JEL478]|eukprot:KXS17851.1 hypothetical protein M427DRAFT_68059 [Gonapodya prolifera JEL478]